MLCVRPAGELARARRRRRVGAARPGVLGRDARGERRDFCARREATGRGRHRGDEGAWRLPPRVRCEQPRGGGEAARAQAARGQGVRRDGRLGRRRAPGVRGGRRGGRRARGAAAAHRAYAQAAGRDVRPRPCRPSAGAGRHAALHADAAPAPARLRRCDKRAGILSHSAARDDFGEPARRAHRHRRRGRLREAVRCRRRVPRPQSRHPHALRRLGRSRHRRRQRGEGRAVHPSRPRLRAFAYLAG